jgi:hypothetical protein
MPKERGIEKIRSKPAFTVLTRNRKLDLRNYYREYKPKKYLFEGQDGGIRSAINFDESMVDKETIIADFFPS